MDRAKRTANFSIGHTNARQDGIEADAPGDRGLRPGLPRVRVQEFEQGHERPFGLVEMNVMSRTRNRDQRGLGKFVQKFVGSRGGEEIALVAPHEQYPSPDLAEVRCWAGWDTKPARVEFEAPTPILFLPQRIFRDPTEQFGSNMLRGRDHSISLDGFGPVRIRAPEGKREPGDPARSATGPPRWIQEYQFLGFVMPRSVVEGDLCAHGMAYEADRRGAQVLTESFEIRVERAHLEFFRVIGIAVSPKIQRQNVVALGECSGHVIPPVSVGPPSMKQHQGGILFAPPMEHMEKSAGTKRMSESLGSGFHGSPRYPPCRPLSMFPGKALLFSIICITFVMIFEKNCQR